MLNSQYLKLVQGQLAHLATQANFETILTTAFGTNISRGKIRHLRQQWLNGNFSVIPPINILTHGELGKANAGYAASLDRIFISSDFLAAHTNDPNAIVSVLLEEIGHKLDTVFNGQQDSPGDEGQIFSLLATGATLSPQMLSALRAENDRAVIEVGGQSIAIEQDNIFGTEENDARFGTDGMDYIYGYGGDDSLYGRGGNDWLSGGDGNDYLSGGDGDDAIHGREGNDSLYGDSGNDTLTGEDGDDSLYGGDGNDYLFGDSYGGSSGNDYLSGDSGNDEIEGGGGDDEIDGGDGADILYGDLGNDTLYGGSGRDRLNGGDGNDNLYGGDSGDNLNGGSGVDTMLGGTGNDNYIVDNVNDIVYENIYEGIDTVLSFVNFTLGAYVENLTLIAGTANINGTGNSLNNIILGNDGNNVISGGTGNDSLTGGNGNDTYLIDADVDLGTDTINEATTGGIDTLDFRTTSTKALNVNLGLTTTQTVATGVQLVIPVVSIENAYGGSLNDILIGNNLNNSLLGGAGNDTLSGGEGNDTLVGGAGNDIQEGGNGNDVYLIDADVDLGTDTITETTTGGIDTLDFRTTTTKAVNVNLSLTTTQTVATGVQLVIPVVSIENVYGGTLNNILTGNSLNNYLLGGGGNDTLSGLVGNDTLNGGIGNDTLNGGIGIDSLTGGTGNDNFLFNGAALTGANTVATVLGRDNITDFKKAELDKIVLSKATFTAITVGAGGSLGAQFANVASDALAATSSAVITYSQATGNLFYNQNGAAAGFGTNGGNFAVATGFPVLGVIDFTIVA